MIVQRQIEKNKHLFSIFIFYCANNCETKEKEKHDNICHWFVHYVVWWSLKANGYWGTDGGSMDGEL